ncbi:hypothetical protein TCAL_01679 [Tigriopus californicus]|uniref:C2H2-type domain-containing protein n=1 Tax=Tigriopus californicus TaxID=6832 RepID=A0A553PL58_TIGCA|nr:hypothetical protein TCAL_01679 [Tigriopus californicus]
MESRVLLPEDLVLSVRINHDCSSSVARLLEQTVGVVARVNLSQGTRFYPLQGTIRVGKLDIYSSLSNEDDLERGRIRQCNWVRFVQIKDDPPLSGRSEKVGNLTVVPGRPNMSYQETPTGHIAFEVVRDIPAGDELVLDIGQIGTKHAQRTIVDGGGPNSIIIRAISKLMSDLPMDLSLPLLMEPSKQSNSPGPSLVEPVAIYCSDASSNEDSQLSLISSSNSPSKKMLSCKYCAKCFDRPSLLNRHVRTHTGERPHVCDICNKGFSTSSRLNTHRRIHSGEKPHECGVCGKRFTASSNLYYHRMTHVKEKPHKCELCQKSFPTPGDLKSHMYIHNGSWPHRCHICDRGFSKVTNLKNHIFLHSGQKPHRCSKCGKCFALGCNMKAHMKTHES